MSDNPNTVVKKRGKISKNIESIKIAIIIGMSMAGILLIIAGIVLKIIDPNVGFASLPLALQAILVTFIKRAPENLITLKAQIEKLLEQEEDPECIGRFVDDVVSRYSGLADNATIRTLVPPMNASVAQHTRAIAISEPINETEPPNRTRTVSIPAQPVTVPPIAMNAYYFPDEDRYEVTPRFEVTPTRRPSIMSKK